MYPPRTSAPLWSSRKNDIGLFTWASIRQSQGHRELQYRLKSRPCTPTHSSYIKARPKPIKAAPVSLLKKTIGFSLDRKGAAIEEIKA